jgi:hypothetical protein
MKEEDVEWKIRRERRDCRVSEEEKRRRSVFLLN